MTFKGIVGTLAVLSFWVVLAGHAHQVYLSWTMNVSKFNLLFMALLWSNSMSFIGMGFCQKPRDYFMVSSRLPAVVLCLLSVVQVWEPRFGIVGFCAVLLFNALVIVGMVRCSASPRAFALLKRTSRTVFTLAYTIGMILQLAKLVTEGTHGASLFYWSALFGTSAIWIWHGALRKDRLLVWVFSAGTIVLAGIVVTIALGR